MLYHEKKILKKQLFQTTPNFILTFTLCIEYRLFLRQRLLLQKHDVKPPKPQAVHNHIHEIKRPRRLIHHEVALH